MAVCILLASVQLALRFQFLDFAIGLQQLIEAVIAFLVQPFNNHDLAR